MSHIVCRTGNEGLSVVRLYGGSTFKVTSLTLLP